MSSVKPVVEIDTVFTADSVEWCPVRNSTGQLLALGTYQLDETTKTRLGSISLYQYSPNSSNLSLTQVAHSQTAILKSGILDIKWLASILACLSHEDTENIANFMQMILVVFAGKKILF